MQDHASELIKVRGGKLSYADLRVGFHAAQAQELLLTPFGRLNDASNSS
jgi:hypothetical protein